MTSINTLEIFSNNLHPILAARDKVFLHHINDINAEISKIVCLQLKNGVQIIGILQECNDNNLTILDNTQTKATIQVSCNNIEYFYRIQCIFTSIQKIMLEA